MKLCEPCYQASIAARTTRAPGVTPCRKCGGTANKLPKKQLCVDCKEMQVWEKKAKRAARAPRRRKACAGCGGPKEAGHRRRYCDACRAAREAPRACNTCTTGTVTQKYAKSCDECKAASLERQRARHREYQRRVSADPKRRARVLAQRKRYRNTKKGREKERERARLRYRLKLQQEGRELQKVYAIELPKQPRINLSTAPLAPFLRAWIREYDATHIDGSNQQQGGQSALAELSGVNARRIYAIVSGEQGKISFDHADALCVAIGETIRTVYVDDERVAA